MIKRICFNSRWIEARRKESNIDPMLIEKAIYVFELLANLVENGVDLIFKGGTSLVLLIPELKRLSIDLDIVTPEGDPMFEKVFSDITGAGVFNRWEPAQRSSKHEIPKKHFKFYYNSHLSNKEEYVLLDVLQIKASESNKSI